MEGGWHVGTQQFRFQLITVPSSLVLFFFVLWLEENFCVIEFRGPWLIGAQNKRSVVACRKEVICNPVVKEPT